MMFDVRRLSLNMVFLAAFVPSSKSLVESGLR